MYSLPTIRLRGSAIRCSHFFLQPSHMLVEVVGMWTADAAAVKGQQVRTGRGNIFFPSTDTSRLSESEVYVCVPLLGQSEECEGWIFASTLKKRMGENEDSFFSPDSICRTTRCVRGDRDDRGIPERSGNFAGEGEEIVCHAHKNDYRIGNECGDGVWVPEAHLHESGTK